MSEQATEIFAHLSDAQLNTELEAARKKMRRIEKGPARNTMQAAASAVHLRHLEAAAKDRFEP